MEIIKEDYISFETAKLLKEKGFNEPCIWLYSKEGEKHYASDYRSPWPNSEIEVDEWSCCTHAMAMKWLREKYNLFIQITIDFSDGAYPMYDVCVVDLARCTSIIVNGYNRYTYTQACEIAIKYCLENLIV